MRTLTKSRFALFFGNRGFFPPELILQARKQMCYILKKQGYEVLVMDEALTKYGAISNKDDAEKYANFLKQNEGKYDGVILSLPNFGDESSAVEALRKALVPIFIQAYPDELNKMAPEFRRDAFCGKFSVMDVFYQYGMKFTSLKPHVVSPASKDFQLNIEHFDRVCRVVNGFKDMVVGAVGSRTTAFKTVRIDELALQQNGITMEVIDLTEVFARMESFSTTSSEYKDKAKRLKDYTTWNGVPDESFDKIVRLAVVLDKLFDEWNLDAMGFRCWIELQRQLNISACVVLSEMNDRKIPVACEVDIGNAVSQYALYRASREPTACLDWNNNYGDEPDQCILFHCGSTAQSLMKGKGKVSDHSMLQYDLQVGPNCSFGCNEGRIAAFPFTFSSMTTRNGQLEFYLGQGEFTEDPIPEEFFGCGGVAKIDNLQDVLLFIGKNGHRHHVSITPGSRLVEPIKEALEYYLGYNVAIPQRMEITNAISKQS
ncbi:MAG: hypothetical protein ABIG61_05180 [Planctomycetota bacterium]